MGRVLLIVALAVAVLLIARLVVGLAAGERQRGAGRAGRLATEVRCERHGVRVRLEADTPDALERARFHVQCPLCSIESARDVPRA